jgi:hypothetical protein
VFPWWTVYLLGVFDKEAIYIVFQAAIFNSKDNDFPIQVVNIF